MESERLSTSLGKSNKTLGLTYSASLLIGTTILCDATYSDWQNHPYLSAACLIASLPASGLVSILAFKTINPKR